MEYIRIKHRLWMSEDAPLELILYRIQEDGVMQFYYEGHWEISAFLCIEDMKKENIEVKRNLTKDEVDAILIMNELTN